jgi:hypothetical protein
MRRIILALVAALLMTSLVACGSTKKDASGVEYSASNCPTADVEHFGEARIAADLGIMYVAFKKFIYAPYQRDHFKSTKSKLQGATAAAALYVFAKKVKKHVIYDSTLCAKVGQPISDLTAKIGDLPGLIKNVATGGASIDALKNTMDGLPGLAKGAGLPGLDLTKGVDSLKDLAGLS